MKGTTYDIIKKNLLLGFIEGILLEKSFDVQILLKKTISSMPIFQEPREQVFWGVRF